METLGTNYGGWCIPINTALNENSIIYSGGVGEDISFDLQIQDKYGCNIVLIDPTKRALKHFDEIKQYYKEPEFKFSGDKFIVFSVKIFVAIMASVCLVSS